MAWSNIPHTSSTARIPWPTQYQIIAGIIWIAGAAATALLAERLGMVRPWSFLVAPVLQWMLTMLQAPVWRKQINVVSLLFLLFDVAINTGSLFFIVRRLDRTDFWQALYTLGAVSPQMGAGVAFGLALVLGTAIAAAPEKIWKW